MASHDHGEGWTGLDRGDDGQAARLDKVDILEAARRMGISSDAVRKRLKRGHLQGQLVDGRWFVLIPPEGEASPAMPPDGLDSDQPWQAIEDTRLDDLERENIELTSANVALASQVSALERDRAELSSRLDTLERDRLATARRLDDVTADRDYLRNALAAALTIKALIPERSESLDPEQPRRWWEIWRR